MTGLIIFASILLFLVLLLSIKARIILEYRDAPILEVRIMGLFRLKLLPKKEKKAAGPHAMSKRKAKRILRKMEKKAAKKAEKERQKRLEKQKKKEQKKKDRQNGVKKKSPLSVSDILELISLSTSLLKTLIGTFFKHLRVRMVRLRVTVATGDAATTAIGYGAVTQSLDILYPYLEQIKGFRVPDRSDIRVDIDYLKESPEIDLRMEFTLRVWHLFAVLFKTLGCAIKRGFPFLFRLMQRKDEEKSKTSTQKQGHRL